MALDDATTALLGQLAESGLKPLHEMTPVEARGLGGMLGAMYGPGPEMARVEEVAIPTPDGPLPGRVLVPAGSPRGVIIYYHGGGWVIGALDEFDTLGRNLAERSSCTVLLVDYRLAPEARYPAASDDAFAALTWVADNLASLAAPGVPVVVMGDSAGGHLATVVARKARDAGGPAVAMQVLVYPVTDSDLETPSYLDPANQLLLSRDGMVWFWDHYVPDAARRTEPDASPLRTPDLSGLPPAVVLLAEHDVLHDEGKAYAQRLRDAGVSVEERVFEGQMHGFFTMINVLPGSQDGIDHAVQAIDRQLSGGAALPGQRKQADDAVASA